MCDCITPAPLSLSTIQLQKPDLTTSKRCRTITLLSSARNDRLKLIVTTRARRNSREFYSELGFKDKEDENLKFESRIQSDKEIDSTDLDILGVNEKVEEEDLVCVGERKEIEERGEVNGRMRLRRGKQMIRRSNLLAKQVISIQSAVSLGFVSQIWVDTASWMVLVVDVRPSLLSGESERLLLEDVTRVGYSVVTPGRRYIGKVRGYSFNVNSGAVELLELDSFGISIIPSSLVSTYALPIEDVLDVLPDTVIVHEAAASRIHRLTKGFWGAQNVGTGEIEEYSESEDTVRSERNRSTRRSSRSPRAHPKMQESDIDWELPMDYL
ncbi:uncharacterized protein LOC126664728 isoform X2 [Mercurialis annua]|uniref:uncharacterized protein LOC126664728 isoform X2 n=1 Tax=Mercurialis annua TaxID=3986 RepID=UPI00215F399F|nr:uncharacterized protein LOC126664728 isoform X2 [Mercurialis annua]